MIIRSILAGFYDLIFTMGGKDDYFRPSYNAFDEFRTTREDVEKTIHLLINQQTVVKLKIIMAKFTPVNGRSSGYAHAKVQILEVDGRPLPADTNAICSKHWFEEPTKEEQGAIFVEALLQCGISGTPAMVGEDYVRNHIRITRMEEAMRRKNGGR